MSTALHKTDLNKEYIYVRRLISVLTNDDSDKLIVEKLKGKNLSSLLYNAKIIDNGKNMTANKKILACVIRAIEREKHLCHRRELEQSWGRKFLNSFNCLYPGFKLNEDCKEHSIFSMGSGHGRQCSHKSIKRGTPSRHTKTSSMQTSKIGVGKNFKRFGCESSIRCVNKNRVSEADRLEFLKSKANSYVGSFQNKEGSYVDSIGTEKVDDEDLCEYMKISQHVPIIYEYKSPTKIFETVCPPSLGPRKLNCVMVHPGRPLPVIKRMEKAEKKTSSTQTSDSSYEPDPITSKVPNNIKLQDLLEAATNLINTRDQREYVRSFLSNFEPPFDLSAGFPPYLKLPMQKSEDVVGKESVYGTNSELSLRSDRLSPVRQTTNDAIKLKEDNVKRYVRDLVCDPWQDTAESIISGVINESLPHDRADYSQLGACILKRLGAYPGSSSYKDARFRKQNLNIPEIVLQCTEFFESDGNESTKKTEQTNGNIIHHDTKDSGQHKSKSDSDDWRSPRQQNYCFIDSETPNNQRVDLLNLSQSSLVDDGISPEKTEVAAQGDGAQDRKNLQLRKPLKITPSGLEQGGKKTKRAGMLDRKSNMSSRGKEDGNCGSPSPSFEPEVKTDTNQGSSGAKPARQRVSIYTVTSEKKGNLVEENPSRVDESATIESVSILKPESAGIIHTNESNFDVHQSQVGITAEITVTATPPPEPIPLPHWEATVAEVETFDGVGEGQKKLTEPISKSEKKQLGKKNRTFQEKLCGKKKGKVLPVKKKPHSDKNQVDLSRNCKVM